LPNCPARRPDPAPRPLSRRCWIEVAAQHGLHCVHVLELGGCLPLSRGRNYLGEGRLQMVAGFDAARQRLLFEIAVFSAVKAELDRARPEVDGIRAEIERELVAGFPTVSLGNWRPLPATTTFVRVAPQGVDGVERAFAISGEILQRAGLTLERQSTGEVVGRTRELITLGATMVVAEMSSWALRCRDGRTFAVSVTAQSPEYTARQPHVVRDLEIRLGQAFGSDRVSSVSGPAPCP
jgi:hypothetical protein